MFLRSKFILRQPTWLLQSVLSYIGFAILLYVWGGVEGLRNLIIAMIVGGLWGTGINIVAQSVGWYRVSKVQEMFIVSPVGPIHYIVGTFLASIVFPLTALIALIPLIYVLNAWCVMIYSLLMGFTTLYVGIMVGLYIVLRVEKPMNVSAITNPISWLLTILPPVYYPASIIPNDTLRAISLLAPTSAAAEIARQLSGIKSIIDVSIPTTILTFWITLGTYLMIKSMKWGLE